MEMMDSIIPDWITLCMMKPFPEGVTSFSKAPTGYAPERVPQHAPL